MQYKTRITTHDELHKETIKTSTATFWQRQHALTWLSCVLNLILSHRIWILLQLQLIRTATSACICVCVYRSNSRVSLFWLKLRPICSIYFLFVYFFSVDLCSRLVHSKQNFVSTKKKLLSFVASVKFSYFFPFIFCILFHVLAVPIVIPAHRDTNENDIRKCIVQNKNSCNQSEFSVVLFASFYNCLVECADVSSTVLFR